MTGRIDCHGDMRGVNTSGIRVHRQFYRGVTAEQVAEPVITGDHPYFYPLTHPCRRNWLMLHQSAIPGFTNTDGVAFLCPGAEVSRPSRVVRTSTISPGYAARRQTVGPTFGLPTRIHGPHAEPGVRNRITTVQFCGGLA